MSLHRYLLELDPPARKALADKVGSTVDYLFLVGYGKRKPKVRLAVAIERESGGRVRCEDLIPDVDWAYLRRAEVA